MFIPYTLNLQQLRIDRQCPDAFAGCGVDRVADRRCGRRHARFADTARQLRVFDQVDIGLRRNVDARHKVIGIVALLYASVVHRDLAVERIADTHDRSALQLRAHAIGIDDRAAIDRHIEPWYRDLTVIADGDMRHDRYVAQKAAMDGNAATLPRRQFLTPIAVCGDEVYDTAQPPGVDQVLIGDLRSELIDAVIRIVDEDAKRLQVKDARRADQLAQILDRVFARRHRKLVGKRADGKGMRDIVDRAVPADAHMARRGAVLATHIGNVVRHVDHTLAQFAAAAVNDVRLERRLYWREDSTMQPCTGTTILVECCFEVLRADCVIIIVLDVVLARPRDFDRGADHAREQRCFGDIVRLRLAAKAAAEQGYVDGNVGFVDTEDLRHGLARLGQVLRRRPGLAAIGDRMRYGIGDFHLSMCQMRNKIVSGDALGG